MARNIPIECQQCGTLFLNSKIDLRSHIGQDCLWKKVWWAGGTCSECVSLEMRIR